MADKITEEAMEMWHSRAIIREGKWHRVYFDSLGKLTVGIGHLVTPADGLKLGDVITPEQIQIFFQKDSAKALSVATKQWKEINILTSEWLAALISANFQLGDFSVKFPNSYALLKVYNFGQVIHNLRLSVWNKQTPTRVNDFILAIEALKRPEIMI